jgi:hypothetical protein
MRPKNSTGDCPPFLPHNQREPLRRVIDFSEMVPTVRRPAPENEYFRKGLFQDLSFPKPTSVQV